MKYFLKSSYGGDIREIKNKDIIKHLKDKSLIRGQTVTIYTHHVLMLKVIEIGKDKIILKLEE